MEALDLEARYLDHALGFQTDSGGFMTHALFLPFPGLPSTGLPGWAASCPRGIEGSEDPRRMGGAAWGLQAGLALWVAPAAT